MKKIVIIFALCVFAPVLPMKKISSIREQLHDHSPVGKPITSISEDHVFKQKVRAFFHDGIVDSNAKIKDSTPATPAGPYSDYPRYLVESHKHGHELTTEEKKQAIVYLYQQIELTHYMFKLGHSEHQPIILRVLGFATMPVRYLASKYILKCSGWEEDLQELAVEEATYTFTE